MSFTSRKLSGEPRRADRSVGRSLTAVLRIGKPLVSWFRHHRQIRAERAIHEQEVSLLRRLVAILFSLGLVVILLGILVRTLLSLHIVTVSGIAGIVGSPLPQDENGFTNILILGQGDDSHQGVDLTDTMIVASFDPHKTKSVVMLSIPRDLYVRKTQNMGRGRINSLYRDYKVSLIRKGTDKTLASRMAMEELAKEVGQMVGVQIHRVARADFIGFQQVVDALGGVDINVPQTIVDTTYPGPNYSYTTFRIEAGPQHLDGETALKYARSRHSTSDFSRSARQQQLLVAIAQRAREKGILRSPSTLTSLYKTVSEHTETTMSLRELIGMAAWAHDIDRSHIITGQINNVSGIAGGPSEAGGFLYNPPMAAYGGAYVLMPVPVRGGGDPYTAIRTYMQLMMQNRTFYLQKPTVDVLNAGARSGLARAMASELIRYGFQINELRNADLPADLPTSLMFARTQTGQTLLPFVSGLLKIPQGQLPPDLPKQDTLGQITILLGADYTYTPIVSLTDPPPEALSTSGTTLTASGSTAPDSSASSESSAPSHSSSSSPGDE